MFNKKSMILSIVFIFVLTTTVFAALPFSDLSESHWAYNTFQWAHGEGIIKGYGDGTVKPSKEVTEAEFLAMLVRSYHADNEVVDENAHWSESAYQVAKKYNYPVNGLYDMEKRNYVINREQVAEIVSGTQGKNYEGTNAIKYLLGVGLAKGKNPNEISIDSYDGDGALTRAEAITFIKNVLDKGITDKLLYRPKTPSDVEDIPPLPDVFIDNMKKIAEKYGADEIKEGSHEGDTITSSGIDIIRDGKLFAEISKEIDNTDGRITYHILSKDIRNDESLALIKEVVESIGVPIDDQFETDLYNTSHPKTAQDKSFEKEYGDYNLVMDAWTYTDFSVHIYY